VDPWIEIIKRAAALVYETIIKPIADFFVDLWNGIVSGLQAAWDWIVNLALTVAGWVNENVIQPVVNFFAKLWEDIKAIFSCIGGSDSVRMLPYLDWETIKNNPNAI